MLILKKATFCNKVGKFDNGYVTYHPDNYFGGELIYECNPGFVLVGNRVRNCEGDGWWSGSSPVCQKETFCELPPSVLNAIPNVQVNNQSKYKVGTEIEYQCDIGFTASFNQDDQNDFSNKIVCLDDGKWSHIRFKCIRNLNNPLFPVPQFQYQTGFILIFYSLRNKLWKTGQYRKWDYQLERLLLFECDWVQVQQWLSYSTRWLFARVRFGRTMVGS